MTCSPRSTTPSERSSCFGGCCCALVITGTMSSNKRSCNVRMLLPFLLAEPWESGSNPGPRSLWHSLQQPRCLTWFCAPQPLVPLSRQSIQIDAQGNQIPDLLVHAANLRTHQVANLTTRCSALV